MSTRLGASNCLIPDVPQEGDYHAVLSLCRTDLEQMLAFIDQVIEWQLRPGFGSGAADPLNLAMMRS